VKLRRLQYIDLLFSANFHAKIKQSSVSKNTSSEHLRAPLRAGAHLSSPLSQQTQSIKICIPLLHPCTKLPADHLAAFLVGQDQSAKITGTQIRLPERIPNEEDESNGASREAHPEPHDDMLDLQGDETDEDLDNELPAHNPKAKEMRAECVRVGINGLLVS